MSQRERLLTGMHGEDRDILARALDLADLVNRYHQPQYTDFYDPYHTGLIVSGLSRLSSIACGADGGYSGAERQRVVICPDYTDPGDVAGELRFLAVVGGFGNNRPSHRDFLGSLLGLGLKRGKLGDILVNPGGAQVVVNAGIAGFIKNNLLKVSRWEVTVREIAREELILPERKFKEINSTVASMRLDAVAAAGYGVSRSKIVSEIAAEKVHLNWQPCRDSSRAVREGDVISIKGRGRLEVFMVNGTSRGGRIFVTLRRLV